ncbi:hypothetical protein HOY82DRAFT_561488 [Tuber indicum]|nr:hypothetical protein HOY82DRAFT_561488 [Tuber indicum]
MSTPLLRRRTIILTVGAVAITAVGAYTGAQLKSDLQARGRNEVLKEGVDGRIRRLVEYRDGLERRKFELEGKIRKLEREE